MNKNLIALAVTATALAGCATPTTQAPTAGEDLNVGIASTCTPSVVDFANGASTTGTIVMTNDGWCALHTKDKAGQPFLLGLVTSSPAHGRILIQKLGGETLIEYTANTRYVGPDRFTVALRSVTPNTPDATIQVGVTVSMGVNLPPEPAPASAAKPAPAARATPARRTTTTH